MDKQRVLKRQKAVLSALSGRIDDFYLAGGTALSLFYFQHRLSVDLDFFSPTLSTIRVSDIVRYLGASLGKTLKPIGRVSEKGKARVEIYNIHFTKADVLKIDFVEDVFPLIKATTAIAGIRVLSLEDIYIRKLYALTGITPVHDKTGRGRLAGGRADSKDFYDLYCLSHIFKPLSKFIDAYGDAVMNEGVVNWFRTYDRMKMTDGVLSLDTDKKADHKMMERHFKEQVDRIIQQQIEGI